MFGGACAARLAPVVDAIGSDETAALFREAVRAVLRDAPGEVRSGLVDRLARMPEMGAEHSGVLEYWPKPAVVMVTVVLQSGTSDDPGDIGRRACAISLELLESVDTAFLAPDDRFRFIEFDHVHTPGAQQRAEMETQIRTIALLRMASDPTDAGRQLEGLSAPRVQELAAVMPDFVRAESSATNN